MMGSMGRPQGTSVEGLQEEVFGHAVDPKVIQRMLPYILPEKRLMAIAIAAMLVFAATQVAVPWLVKLGIDQYIADNDKGGLLIIVGLFFGNAVINWIALYVQDITITKAGQGVLLALRRDMFSHMQKQSLRFFDKTEVGRIMSRVQGDVWQLQEFMSTIVMTLGDFLSLGGIIIVMLLLNVQLGLISLAVVPLLIITMVVWQPFAKKSFVRARTTISVVNASLNENISGVRVVQAMNRQDENLRQFDAKNHDNLDSFLSAGKLSAAVLPMVDFLPAASIGLVLYFGASMVTNSAIEIGLLIAFIMYIQRFFDPIRNLTMQYTQLQRAMASGTRIFETLDVEPDMVDAPGAIELPPIKGAVELRDVSFAYKPGEDVTKNLNLRIEPGQAVAIVGPTGAGKTTLVSLIARFYDVERGRGAVLVDGHDVRDVTRTSLASQMSMVLQEPFLFSGSVRENIKYNHGDVSDTHMIEAAEAVGAHGFIEKLENGYDTYLEERGVNLSVGQRQLISFARAIVADPKILILDEATANIDSHTEAQIQAALQTLLKGRTAIVIAHRLSTIRGADKIVVLNLGELIEEGTHDELLDRDGLYAHLCHMNYAALEEVMTG
jgi:ATP-binding cassette subfamily B multidrug efflux pump